MYVACRQRTKGQCSLQNNMIEQLPTLSYQEIRPVHSHVPLGISHGFPLTSYVPSTENHAASRYGWLERNLARHATAQGSNFTDNWYILCTDITSLLCFKYTWGMIEPIYR